MTEGNELRYSDLGGGFHATTIVGLSALWVCGTVGGCRHGCGTVGVWVGVGMGVGLWVCGWV